MTQQKEYFSMEDFERAFSSGSFRNKALLVETFSSIFSTYPPVKLDKMSYEHLDKVVKKLRLREDVRAVQETIAREVIDGENSLQHLITISFAQLQKLGIAPPDKNKIYPKPYQEVWAYCGREVEEKKKAKDAFEPVMPIAKGLFDPRIPLENIFFTPENTFYSDLPALYRDTRLACKHDYRDVVLRRAAALYVFRDKASDEELGDRIRSIIRDTAGTIYKNRIKSPEKRYETMERAIVEEFLEMFKSVKTAGALKYKKIYKIFEWVIRENIDIGQILEDHELKKVLRGEIERHIPLPYAVIRARVKEDLSECVKIAAALYNIRKGDEKGTVKKYGDKYGLRIVLRTIDDIYNLIASYKNIVGIETRDDEDYIKESKPNGYRSYHMRLEMGGISYDLQLRTHQMDRDAEKGEQQAHDAVLREKLEQLKVVPKPVKLVIATVYGL